MAPTRDSPRFYLNDLYVLPTLFNAYLYSYAVYTVSIQKDYRHRCVRAFWLTGKDPKGWVGTAYFFVSTLHCIGRWRASKLFAYLTTTPSNLRESRWFSESGWDYIVCQTHIQDALDCNSDKSSLALDTWWSVALLLRVFFLTPSGGGRRVPVVIVHR